MPEYIHVSENNEYEAAAKLFREYADWLNIDLCFQRFEEELLQLKTMYGPPGGGIILARADGEFAGCVAVRNIGEAICELKRMYVKAGYRNKGIGAALLHEALELATKYGYKKIRLDTLSNMTPAIHLYKANGFYEIAAYYHNPEDTAVYFEKLL